MALLGIDFGTSQARGLLVPDDGHLEASRVVRLPAVVSFDGPRITVGEPALMMAGAVPDVVVPGIKRLLGRPASDALVAKLSAQGHYRTRELSYGDLELRPATADDPNDLGMSVVTGCSEILRQLTQELSAGPGPHEVVVAIPAWFEIAHRESLLQAATQADLRILRFVQDTVASTIWEAGRRQLEGPVVALNVGAGGVSAALLQCGPRSIELKTVAGSVQHGGDDIDAELAATTLVRPQRQLAELLRQACCSLKRELSTEERAERAFEFRKSHTRIHVERWELELMLGPLVHLVSTLCRRVLRESATPTSEVSAMVATGGMLSLGMVAQQAARYAGAATFEPLPPAETTVLGTARLAAILLGRSAGPTVVDGEGRVEEPSEPPLGRRNQSLRVSSHLKAVPRHRPEVTRRQLTPEGARAGETSAPPPRTRSGQQPRAASTKPPSSHLPDPTQAGRGPSSRPAPATPHAGASAPNTDPPATVSYRGPSSHPRSAAPEGIPGKRRDSRTPPPRSAAGHESPSAASPSGQSTSGQSTERPRPLSSQQPRRALSPAPASRPSSPQVATIPSAPLTPQFGSGAARSRSASSTHPPSSAPSPPTGSIAPASHGPPAALPTEGQFCFPASAGAALAMPLSRALESDDLEPISLPVLLRRVIARSKLQGTLQLNANEMRLRIDVDDGATELDRGQHSLLLKFFDAADGTWQLLPQRSCHEGLKQRYRISQLAAEATRRALHPWDAAELAEAFSTQLDEAPSIVSQRAAAVARLGLKARERRFLNHHLDERSPLRELAKNGGLSKLACYRLIALLDLYHVLNWQPAVASQDDDPAIQLERRADELARCNHFETLQVHWSATAAEIGAQHVAICQELSETGPAHAANPLACARILHRVQQAWDVLSDQPQRRAYRDLQYPDQDFEAAQDLAARRSQTLLMQGRAFDARKSELAAQELSAGLEARSGQRASGEPKPRATPVTGRGDPEDDRR